MSGEAQVRFNGKVQHLNGKDNSCNFDYQQMERFIAATDRHTAGIEKFANAINMVSERVETFMEYSKDGVPIKVVYLIFGLVLGLFFGIEAVRWFFEVYLGKL
jgi:hypothetical protein